MYRITELGRLFGLSRSTLLYYDRIGLLNPSGRSEAGYRRYSRADRDRLESICSFRKAGLTIEDTRRLLERNEDANGAVLRSRLKEIGENIHCLQTQQRLLANMLRLQSMEELPIAVDKEAWIEMLRAAGMDDAAMGKWHSEFEKRAPDAHHQFLLSLGISEDEAVYIRRRSAEGG